MDNVLMILGTGYIFYYTIRYGWVLWRSGNKRASTWVGLLALSLVVLPLWRMMS